MSTFGPDQSPPPAISNKQLALIVYILYFVAYFTGITALIGVIIAHVQVASADPLLATHYRFQIRTFWIGILYLVIGTILTVAIVGIAILLWWFVWSLVAQREGHARLERQQADCQSGFVDVRLVSRFRRSNLFAAIADVPNMESRLAHCCSRVGIGPQSDAQ